MKDLYNENYAILMKEGKEHLDWCKDSLFSWMGRSSITTKAILSKVL